MDRRQLLDIQETVSLYCHKGVITLKEKAWGLKGGSDTERMGQIIRVLGNMSARLGGVWERLETEYEEATKEFKKGDMITADWRQYELGHELAEEISSFKFEIDEIWRSWSYSRKEVGSPRDAWIKAAYKTSHDLFKLTLRFSKEIRRIVCRTEGDRHVKELGDEPLNDFK